MNGKRVVDFGSFSKGDNSPEPNYDEKRQEDFVERELEANRCLRLHNGNWDGNEA